MAEISFDEDPFAGISTLDLFDSIAAFSPDIEQAASLPSNREPTTLLGKVFDLLSRGQYASAKFFDSMANEANSTFASALAGAAVELIDPKERLSFTDVLERAAPDWAARNPKTTKVLGFVGDVALDPISWLAWQGKVLNAAGKARYLDEVGKLTTGLTDDVLVKSVSKIYPEIGEAWQKIGPEAAAAAKKYGLPGFDLKIATEERAKLLERMKLMKDSPEVQKEIAAFQRIDEFRARESAWSAMAKIPEMWEYSGYKLAGVPILPAKALEGVAKITGLKRAFDAVRSIERFRYDPLVKEVNHEYSVLLHGIQDEAKDAGHEIYDAARKMGFDLTPEQLKQTGLISGRVDDAGAKFYLSQVDQVGKEEAIRRTIAEAPNIRERIFAEMNVTKEQRDILGRFYQGYNKVGDSLMRAGILKYLLPNYSPRIYDEIKNPVEFLEDLPDVRNPMLAAAKSRVFNTAEEAIEKGKNPITDAMVLYTSRYADARRAIIRKDHKEMLLKVFPDGVPEKYAKDYRFIGEGDYGRGLTDFGRTGLQMYDKLTNVFRAFATVIRPAFVGKQLIANTFQEYMTAGARALGAFDPRVLKDSAMLQFMDSRIIPRGSEVYEKVASSRIANQFGDQSKLGELADEVKELLTSRSATDFTTISRNVTKELEYERRATQYLEKTVGGEWYGLMKTLAGAARYTSWPGMLENFMKTSFYLNARRLGMGKKEAMDRTYQALFDYAHGLSQSERRFARRIIPFYSYQRFAVPLITRTFFQHPGRLINPEKTTRALFDVIGRGSDNQELTPSDRYVLPGYLLEQNFQGKDDESKAVFRHITNITPIDMFDTIEEDRDGDLDLRKTLERGVVAQIAPLFKIPLQLAADKNFFTDKAIDPAKNKRAGIIGQVDPDRFVANILSTFLASGVKVPGLTGLPGLGTGQALAEMLPDRAKSAMLNLIGWEEGLDPKTGDSTVYVNPYRMLVLSEAFPGLTQAVRFARNRPAVDNWLDLLSGTLTQRIDMEAAKVGKFKQNEYRISEMRRALKESLETQRLNEAEERRAELEAFLAKLTAEYAQYDPNDTLF